MPPLQFQQRSGHRPTLERKMPSDHPLQRKERLRRVVRLCCYFGTNLAYYRVGWSPEHKQLLDRVQGYNFWRTVNGNFLDVCVLEWCKLFGDQRGKHYWGKIVKDRAGFKAALLDHLGLEEDAFQKEVAIMRTYRDKWVAHLDSDITGIYPALDVAKKAVRFYHAHIVKHEAEPGDLAGLPLEFDKGYQDCEDEAKAIYQRQG